MKNSITVGMDLGDKNHEVCILNEAGVVKERRTIANKKEAVVKCFEEYRGALVAIEAGTHSAWVSRVLESLECEVLVGNPRKLRMIWASSNKNDVADAEMLGRVARFDRALLYPIQHRGPEAQQDLALLKARDMLVNVRTGLVNHVRGAVKSMGYRVACCSTDSFARKARESLPAELTPALLPVVEEIEALTKRICAYDKQVSSLIEERHPDAKRLSQVSGVGPLTSLGFVLSLEDANRFKKSRTVGAYLGLTTRRDQSGETDKQLRITKNGDEYVRRLLVGCAHYILGPFGPECDLRRFGEKLAKRGGKNAKRRAIVAVARKLSVLLHRLWVTGAEYDPDYKKNVLKKVA